MDHAFLYCPRPKNASAPKGDRAFARPKKCVPRPKRVASPASKGEGVRAQRVSPAPKEARSTPKASLRT